MSEGSELSRLFAAERAETRPSADAEQGLAELRGALSAGAPPLPVAHGPLAGLGAGGAVKGAILSGLVALGLTASGLVLLEKPPATEPQASAVASARADRVATPAPPPAPPAAPPPAPTSQEPRKAPPRAASAEPESEPPSTFAKELSLIKSAKQSVDAGRDSLAKAQLDEHARLYPQGVFRNEREALAVLLTCRAAPSAGQAAAQRYVAQNPGSPLVDRIARACRLEPAAAEPARSAATAPVPTANFPDAKSDK